MFGCTDPKVLLPFAAKLALLLCQVIQGLQENMKIVCAYLFIFFYLLFHWQMYTYNISDPMIWFLHCTLLFQIPIFKVTGSPTPQPSFDTSDPTYLTLMGVRSRWPSPLRHFVSAFLCVLSLYMRSTFSIVRISCFQSSGCLDRLLFKEIIPIVCL